MVFTKDKMGDVTAYRFDFHKNKPNSMSIIFYQMDDILIDTGHYRNRRQALEGLNHERLSVILLTHYHEDHSGNAFALSKMKQIKVLGHPVTAEKLKNGFRILPYQRLLFGKSPLVKVHPYPPIIETDHYTLFPIHTPGHSKDHTVYLEKENGRLFSGDLYISSKIKFFRSDEFFLDQICSLKKITNYNFDSLMYAANPCITGGKKKLQKKLEFMENFYGDIQFKKQKGYSEKSILKSMKNRESTFVKWFTTGDMSFANMVRSAFNTSLTGSLPLKKRKK